MDWISVQQLMQCCWAAHHPSGKPAFEIVGDVSRHVWAAGPLADATRMDNPHGVVTMIDSPKKIGAAMTSGSRVIVVPTGAVDSLRQFTCDVGQHPLADIDRQPDDPDETETITLIAADDVHSVFAPIVCWFREQQMSAGGEHGTIVAPSAQISRNAEIGDHCQIGENVVIDSGVSIGDNVTIAAGSHVMTGCVVMRGTRIGQNCTLYPQVTLYENTILHDDVTLHAGTVLGAHGFGYRRSGNQHLPTPQLGYVLVEADVEIGACVTIDRGTYGSTRIGVGTKIDNQVMIGHNCQIGRRNLLCSQVGIAGSSSTGDDVILAGQVGLKDHIQLGDGVIVGAQAGVMDDLESANVYLGSPATTQKDQMQIMAVQRRLPEMRREIKHLRRAIEELQSQNEKHNAASTNPNAIDLHTDTAHDGGVSRNEAA
ncbi:MAG: UDP-3-O-(3-hydroxymyristoyl)glucosamine N-acyltransferase [Planctomycetota bacterium]